ncbi:coiled-coil domain-containing protein 86-like [Haliotis asinina]|uniref:coiled-coil domain-containing protein 86-like n=1 Tax=Haliotis asinina TaxID=109174 RepID=UPI003531BAA0
MAKSEGLIAQKTETVKKSLHNIPRGQPKSGRAWKTPRPTRHSEIKKVKSLKSSWSKKMADKAEKKSIKEFQNRLKEARNEELERKRKRAEANQKRREMNALKSEVVQTIKSTAKIKRMKKKQLRTLAKR